MVNEHHQVDNPNEDIVGRLCAHGGLATVDRGEDGIMRAKIRVRPSQFIWEPAIIVMPGSGELELEFQNEDQALACTYVSSHLTHAPSA